MGILIDVNSQNVIILNESAYKSQRTYTYEYL